VPKQTLTRKAADNAYFHRDFHLVLNNAIAYLHEKFGEAAVRDYLVQFAAAWYAPLKKSLQEKGLAALQEHYEKIYTVEGARSEMVLTPDELTIRLLASPAVEYIKSKGQTVSTLFYKTVETVNREICRDTSFDFELAAYHSENGSYTLHFFRRKM